MMKDAGSDLDRPNLVLSSSGRSHGDSTPILGLSAYSLEFASAKRNSHQSFGSDTMAACWRGIPLDIGAIPLGELAKHQGGRATARPGGPLR